MFHTETFLVYFNFTALKFFACVGNILQVCAGSFLRGLLL